MRVVKSFVREDYETKKFYGGVRFDVRKDFLKAEKLLALNNPLSCCSACSRLPHPDQLLCGAAHHRAPTGRTSASAL